MKASGPKGGPSWRNWIAHIWQRRLHWPTGSTWRNVGRSIDRLLPRGHLAVRSQEEDAEFPRPVQPPEDRERRDQGRGQGHLGHAPGGERGAPQARGGEAGRGGPP